MIRFQPVCYLCTVYNSFKFPSCPSLPGREILATDQLIHSFQNTLAGTCTVVIAMTLLACSRHSAGKQGRIVQAERGLSILCHFIFASLCPYYPPPFTNCTHGMGYELVQSNNCVYHHRFADGVDLNCGCPQRYSIKPFRF